MTQSETHRDVSPGATLDEIQQSLHLIVQLLLGNHGAPINLKGYTSATTNPLRVQNQSSDANAPSFAFLDDGAANILTGTKAAVTIGKPATMSSTLNVVGDFSVNTNKFNVTAASGNTAIAGTANVVGNFSVATNKFTVAAASGNTVVAGTAAITGDVTVNTNKFTITASTGAFASGTGTITGTLAVSSDVAINTNKWVATATTGAIAQAGDLNINSGKFTVTSSTGAFGSGAGTVTGTLAVSSDFAVNTSKFVVTASSGNTTVAGTLGVTGDVAVNTNKFNITATTGAFASGSGTVTGSLSCTSDFTVGTSKFTAVAASGNTAVAGTLNVTGLTTLAAAHVLSNVVSPSQITSNQNNYAPSGWDTAAILQISADAARDITGLSATGIANGQVLSIRNNGGFAITLKHENASSTAANRFNLPGGADVVLSVHETIQLYYFARWFPLSGAQ